MCNSPQGDRNGKTDGVVDGGQAPPDQRQVMTSREVNGPREKGFAVYCIGDGKTLTVYPCH